MVDVAGRLDRRYRGPSTEGPRDELACSARRFQRLRPPGEVIEQDVEARVRYGVNRLAVLVEGGRHERDHDGVAQRYAFGFDDNLGEMLDRPDPGSYTAAVAEQGPQSQQGLGEVLSVDPSNVVGLLNELEERGLITRQRDPLRPATSHRRALHDRRRSARRRLRATGLGRRQPSGCPQCRGACHSLPPARPSRWYRITAMRRHRRRGTRPNLLRVTRTAPVDSQNRYIKTQNRYIKTRGLALPAGIG